MISRAWRKSLGGDIRGCCWKLAKSNSDAAEFSQEQPVEGLQQIGERKHSNVQPPNPIRIRAPVRLPDLIIVDGGKGQLSSACRELQRLGLHELPIIGLAKEYEEIYRPGRALAVAIPPDSGALRLLQRIRDEAHRFANTYHQLTDEEADRRKYSR